MARNLVALKFCAGLHMTEDKVKGHKIGHAKYPDFNRVDLAVRKGMDWCIYIDAFGTGMQYDKNCGHKEEGDTKFGEQCCVIAVPEEFADAAMAVLPGELTELTDVEFEDFYDNKAHAHESAEIVDKDALGAIIQKEKLGLEVPEKADAVDITTEARGIRKNHNKKWADKKVRCGCTIINRKKV